MRRYGRAPGALLLCCVLASTAAFGADARDALQKAALLVQQGRLDEADQQARLALADPDTRAAAYSVLGTIRFQQQRLPESVGFLQKAIDLGPRLLGARLTLAQVYTLQGRQDKALLLLRQAIAIDPSNAAPRLALARAETERGHYSASLELAAPVLPAFQQSPDGLVVLATNYLKTNHKKSAAALAARWNDLPNAPQDWSVKFAIVLLEGGVVSEAIGVLERAKLVGPPSFELDFNLAGAYLLNGDAARALETYDEALAVKPDSVAALQQAAVTAERAGQLERSLSYWIRAKKLAPDAPEVLLGFGRVCLKLDLLDDAEPALARAATLKPSELTYQYTLAVAKVGKREFEAAQQLLEPLAAARPDDSGLQYGLGAVLYVQGHLAEASARLKDSVRLQPDQLAAPYYLALAERDQGHDADAIDILRALLQRHPEHAASYEALGGLLMTAQKYEEAEVNLQKAVQLNPKSVKANYQLGLLLARLGRKEEADKQLALAKTLRQDDEATSRLQLRLMEPTP
jgi:tetratricopeptide (TPR) repeat protein